MAIDFEMHQMHDGEIWDQRIEELLAAIYSGQTYIEGLDELFNEVVREFIDVDPSAVFIVSVSINASNANFVYLPLLLGFDIRLSARGHYDWPVEGFDYMPDALYSSTLRRNGDAVTDSCPGKTINQSICASLIEYCRQKSWESNNQGQLPIH